MLLQVCAPSGLAKAALLFYPAARQENDVDINNLDDAVAATAFRRLVTHLRHRSDAENIDLMGLAGFCRNCLADWVAQAEQDVNQRALSRDEAREIIYGMPFSEWKERFQGEASEQQLARMKESVAKNAPGH